MAKEIIIDKTPEPKIKWKSDGEGNVYKDINKIYTIKHIKEIKDIGFNRPIKAIIHFKEDLHERFPEGIYMKIRQMLYETHNMNEKMFVQSNYIENGMLVLIF